MKRYVMLLAVALLMLGAATGCGASTKPAEGTRGGSADSTTRAASTAAAITTPSVERSSERKTPVVRLRRGSLPLSDGDGDNPKDIDGSGDVDPGIDGDVDNSTPESHKFPDRDDNFTLNFGHGVSPAVARLLASLTESYYAAAAADDGGTACSMMLPSIAASLRLGRSGVPPRPGETCRSVMSAVFKGSHAQLQARVKVVDVRVQGVLAQVVFGSKTLPPTVMTFKRYNDAWMVAQLGLRMG